AALQAEEGEEGLRRRRRRRRRRAGARRPRRPPRARIAPPPAPEARRRRRRRRRAGARRPRRPPRARIAPPPAPEARGAPMTARWLLPGGLAAAALAAGLTCGPGGSSRERGPAAEAPPRALLPEPGPPQAPARSVLAGADGTTLAAVDTRGGCHPDVYAQQQASSHAYSSFSNPIYRVAVDKVREEAGLQPSRMCGGCHDIALLADGIMDAEVTPEDLRGHAGVTCRVCHGIEEATRDGNGSYTLSRRPVVFPRDGDPASLEAHRASVKPLRSAEMCGSCHRSFLDDGTGNRGVFLTGQDDLTGWLGSAYNHSGLGRIDDVIEKQDCIACHMPREPARLGDPAAENGTITSHRFTGGHTWLAAMLGDEEQLARQRDILRGALSIDLAGAQVVGGARHLPAAGAPV